MALIGTTGQLGREAVCQLSKAGIAVKCLLRHDVFSVAPPASLLETGTQIPCFLSWLLPRLRR
jgi:hypothetical protein